MSKSVSQLPSPGIEAWSWLAHFVLSPCCSKYYQ